MTEFQILLTVMLSGFGFMGALLLVIWNRLEIIDVKLGTRIDKLSDKVDDIDRRICRIEGSLASQGHCLFHQQKQEKKAE